MARLTNNQILNMNDHQKVNYAGDHPKEAPRIAALCTQTAGKCMASAIKHQGNELLKPITSMFANPRIE